ncbi:unnamed protein product [Aphanomyces euteiches]
MKLTVALTTLLAIAVVAQVEIVGGKEATAGKHLYVTGLRQTTTASDQCGGSLIAPNVVLTAAHCTGHGLKRRANQSHQGNQKSQEQRQHELIRLCCLALGTQLDDSPVQVSFDNIAGGVPTIVRGWGATSSGGS